MFKIQSGVIYLTRGDSATIKVSITLNNGVAYEMQEGDKLTLTVKSAPKKNAALIFNIESDTTSLTINPSDTKDKSIGQYSADIQLSTSDGHIYTIWPEFNTKYLKSEDNWKNFWIAPEVTTNE